LGLFFYLNTLLLLVVVAVEQWAVVAVLEDIEQLLVLVLIQD
jgi:hypothetical protein